MNDYRLASRLFFASAALLAVLVAMQLGTGVTQQWFESVHPLDEYAARLRSQGAWLRAIVAVDDVFVAAYASAVVLLGLVLRGRGSALWGIVLVAGVTGGLLDLEENHHMIAMLTTVQRGGALEPASVEHRMLFSAFKWLVSPLAYCFFGLGFDARTRAEHAVRLFPWLWMLPLTAAVLVVDDPTWVRPLAFARLLSVVGGFVSLGLVMARRATPARAGVTALDGSGSGAPA